MPKRLQRIFAAVLLLAMPVTIYAAGIDSCNSHLLNAGQLHPFLKKLKAEGAKGERANFLKFVQFPLRVSFGKKRKVVIENAAELKKTEADVFSHAVQQSIKKIRVEDLFCNSQGVMIDNGRIWINDFQNKMMGIRTINVPGTQ